MSNLMPSTRNCISIERTAQTHNQINCLESWLTWLQIVQLVDMPSNDLQTTTQLTNFK